MNNNKKAVPTQPTPRKKTEKPAGRRRMFCETDFDRYYDAYFGCRETVFEKPVSLDKRMRSQTFYLDIQTCSILAQEEDEQASRVSRANREFYRYTFQTGEDAESAFCRRCLPLFKEALNRMMPRISDEQALGFFKLWMQHDLMRSGRKQCYPRKQYYGYSVEQAPSQLTSVELV